MKKNRGLSEQFMGDLKEGMLGPLLERVHLDTTLDLQIRENYINIYYRGGSLLKVTASKTGIASYLFEFNQKYDKSGNLVLPSSTVVDCDSCKAWVGRFPEIKDTMDLWFGKHPKNERALQQTVVWENNDSPWAGGTDYFILDIEYDSRKGRSEAGAGGRFDLIALRWESDGSARKLKGRVRPRLAVIEMKSGDGALKGKAGMLKHWKDFQALSRPPNLENFQEEMLNVFQQKCDLKLIPSLLKNRHHNRIDDLDPAVEFIFLLAGHDPAKKHLKEALDYLQRNPDIFISTSSFAGFALYKENIHQLPEFLDRYEHQI